MLGRLARYWHEGGTAIDDPNAEVASLLARAFQAFAVVISPGGSNNAALHSWRFCIRSSTAPRSCIFLEDVPMQVQCLSSHLPSELEAYQARTQANHRRAMETGNTAAQTVLQRPEQLASIMLMFVPTDTDFLLFEGWRTDLLETLSTQLGCSVDTVPHQVLKRVDPILAPLMDRETPDGSIALKHSINLQLVQRSFTCWHCGAKPAALKHCSRCKLARYCNVECQRLHRAQHKSECTQPAQRGQQQQEVA